jgi:type IV secretion system protein VirD4
MTSSPNPERSRHTALALALAASERAGHGLYLGAGANGPHFAPPEQCLLALGPPRSGKTSALVVPNVLCAPGGVVCVSTKADVLAATHRARGLLGGCQLFDPSGQSRPPAGVALAGWSPLLRSRHFDDAVLAVDAMLGVLRPASSASGSSAHFTERAGALLAALFHAGALDHAEMAEVASSVNRRESGRWREVLARADATVALDLLEGVLATEVREQSAIWSSAASVLAAYRTSAALEACRADPVDLAGVVEGHGSLYVVAPTEHQEHLAPLIAGLVRDLRSVAYRHHAELADKGHKMRPVLLVLDELANIAPLRDLPALVAEGASQGVLTIACLQDLSQARARWGVAAEGFLSLFGAKVVLGGIGDTATLERLSLLAGERRRVEVAISRSGRRARQRSLSGRDVPALPPAEIARPAPGRALLMIGSSARQLRLTPWFDHSPFREAGGDDRTLARGGVHSPRAGLFPSTRSIEL